MFAGWNLLRSLKLSTLFEKAFNFLGTTDDSKAHDIARGVVGAGIPVGGVAISTIQALETWLRLTSLCIGILVGLLTLISLAISNYRKIWGKDRL